MVTHGNHERLEILTPHTIFSKKKYELMDDLIQYYMLKIDDEVIFNKDSIYLNPKSMLKRHIFKVVDNPELS